MGKRPGARRRSVIDFGKAQVADVTTGDSAGGDIIHGLNPDRVADILEKVLDSQQRVEMRMQAVEIKLRDDKVAEAQERYTRQLDTDERRAAEQIIVLDAFDGVRAQIAEVRRWQFWQGLVIGAIVVALALIAFFGWRAVYGAGLALVAGLAARILGR